MGNGAHVFGLALVFEAVLTVLLPSCLLFFKKRFPSHVLLVAAPLLVFVAIPFNAFVWLVCFLFSATFMNGKQMPGVEEATTVCLQGGAARLLLIIALLLTAIRSGRSK